MKIRVKPAALKQSRWQEYVVRFVFGGTVTVLTGIIARKYGPVVGGLFLAFPAIFPASVTLVQKHEAQKASKDGHDGQPRGRDASGVDAIGAVLGSFGLLAFGAVVWLAAGRMAIWQLMAVATVAWQIVSILVWAIRQRIRIGGAYHAAGGRAPGHGKPAAREG